MINLENKIELEEQTSEKNSALVVAATCMIAFMGVGLVDPILKTIALQLNATPAETTLLFTSYMLVTGVVMLFTGFLSSRIGLKKTLMMGLLIIVLFAGLGGLSNNIGLLIGLRAGWGIGNALFVSTALATIVSILVGNTEKAIMMYEAAIGCGMAIGPLLGGVLGSGSWRYPFFGVAFLMLCAFVALAILLPEIEKPKRKVQFLEGVKALANHKLRSVGLIALLYNFGFFTLLAYAPFLLTGYTEMQVGFIFFGWGVLLAISSIFVAPFLERKYTTYRTIMTAFVFFTFCLILLGLGTSIPILVPISIVLAGFFQGIINTLLTTIAMEIPGLERNVASSSYSFVRFFGGALAPFIAGKIGEIFDEKYSFYFAAIIVLLSLGFIVYHRQYFVTEEGNQK
ncbi:MFS transporter [Enterococcus thailandicus]|uniref:MFS transporter n=1 Tax=Enterococcus TaxID=1350 RepID=UPI00090048DA|nr:MFS transporter [Enterococcus thailandicus]MDK4353008.1 MFS transporter [Enterococcus thailandicus]MDT2734586.1 MFS transporter [Enterococcus thailandicus]OJG94423.1 major facilitator superfamily transporter [Enterococcus thailandicus]